MEFSPDLRSALLRNIVRNGFSWSGRTSFLDFYGKIFDLDTLPSGDSRYKNAHDDMWQHTVNNDDWSENDILEDARFNPLQLTNEGFSKFVDMALNADTRSKDELDRLVRVIGPILAHAGIRIDRYEEFGIFEGYKVRLGPDAAQSLGASSADGHKLRPSQRMSLIDLISVELQRRFTYNDISAYLGAFAFPRPASPYDGVNSKRLFAAHTLQSASAEVLIAIAQDLELALPTRTTTDPPRNWHDTSRFRLFVSHIAAHKDRATRLKACLAPFAIDAFVAHEDIEPTLEWQSEIEKALNTMDAFLAIHTIGFSKSFWTQQEIGFAVGRGVKIVSFQMGEDPTGFISKQQALARRSRTAEEIAIEINAILSKDFATKGKLTAAKEAAGLQPRLDEIPY